MWVILILRMNHVKNDPKIEKHSWKSTISFTVSVLDHMVNGVDAVSISRGEILYYKNELWEKLIQMAVQTMDGNS